MARKGPKPGPFTRMVTWVSWSAAIVLGLVAGIFIELSYGHGWGLLAGLCAASLTGGIIGLATRRRRRQEALERG